jgi:glycosyltransferase involved in cell wall biosynthesis
MLKAKGSLGEKEELKEKYGCGSKKVFLFVGRLTEVKNVELLIRAFDKVKKENDNVALCLVGDGNLRESLQNLTSEISLKDVYFAGYKGFPDNVEFYKMADVFVLPSSHEPWGLVVNEAMIMELPLIVSSKVGCRLDLVNEGENGFIFENENEKDLVAKMIDILNADLTKMGNKSFDMISKWNFKYFLESFLGAIENAR